MIADPNVATANSDRTGRETSELDTSVDERTTSGSDTVAAGGAAPGSCPDAGSCINPGDVLKGGPAADVIEAGGDNDTLIGDAGADILRGQGGRDRLDGRSGNDVLAGGSSKDVADYSSSPLAVKVNLTSRVGLGWGHDTLSSLEALWGSRGSDVLVGTPDADEIRGSAEGAGDRGNDVLRGLAGDDLLIGDRGSGPRVRWSRERHAERRLYEGPSWS